MSASFRLRCTLARQDGWASQQEKELREGKREMSFFYVYILQCEVVLDHFYVGFTEDMQTRLYTHNSGQVPHTSRFRPWRIKTTIAFTDRQRAIEFESYLKSSSGRAFAKKRL
jgi:putative endonuclease